MKINNSRRSFLKKTSMVSLGYLGLYNCVVTGCSADVGSGFGTISHNEGDILSLPKGFSAKVISRKGDVMNDGFLSPGAHDGMGMFDWTRKKIMLIRNHELTPGAYRSGPFGVDNKLLTQVSREKVYDFASGEDYVCVGGTTTLVYDESKQKVELEYLSLTGTVRNCSGGVTPWNSWITCEETNFRKGDGKGFLEKDHGYNFEVPATDKVGLIDPKPLKAMGRFVHESVAVHPMLGIVYQTEDEGDGLLYRYLPHQYGKLYQGGRLQCLVINEWKGADTRNHNETDGQFPERKLFDVSWVDLDDVESPDSDLRLRGRKLGAAIFASGEGMSYGKGELFFTASSGGKAGHGQIFRYIPSTYEGESLEKDFPAKLELYIESKSVDAFQYCDNLTVAPWGDVIICEDKADARIIGITPNGRTYIIAQNVGYRESEFAGPVFSPSGNTLFVNIQSPGLTLAITGPWKVGS